MSRCLLIAVPKGRWPSVTQLNAALQNQSFPVVISLENGRSADDPWQLSDDGLGVRFLSDDTDGELEADIRYLSNADGASGFESYFLDDKYLAELGAKNVSLEAGDYLLELSFPLDGRFDVPADEWKVGAQLGATLIRQFGAFGFIDETEDCGTLEFADRLILNTMGSRRDGVFGVIKGLFGR